MARTFAVLVLTALAVLLAGCGGSENTAATGAAEVAGIVPADVPVLLAFETDPESEQWRQAEQLLGRFPGKDKLFDELSRELSDEGISVEADLLPALGDDTYLAFLDLDEGDDVVVITKPRDPQKLEQLLEEADEPSVTRVVDGWTLVAESEGVLDRFGAEGDRLDGSEWFEAAQGRLEDDALVTLYANGPALQQASAPEGCETPEPAGELEFAVGTLVAQDDGLRMLFEAAGEGAADLVGDETLLAHVPARALAYLGGPSFDAAGFGLSGQLRCALDDAGAPDVERVLGVPYDDIVDLFAGGFAFYTGPGLLIPELTLVLEPEDEARALATLDELAGTASGFFGETGKRRVGEIDARELQVGPVTILYGGGDGRVVVTTAPDGFDALRDDGDSLEDDERFRDTRDGAGVGDDAQINAYLDLQGLIELLGTVSAFSDEGVPPEVQANLEPLESLIVWGDVSDPDEPELGLFLGIR